MMRKRGTCCSREYNPYRRKPMLPEDCQRPVGQVDPQMSITMDGQAHSQKNRPDKSKPRHFFWPGEAIVEPVAKKHLHDRHKTATKQSHHGCSFDHAIENQGHLSGSPEGTLSLAFGRTFGGSTAVYTGTSLVAPSRIIEGWGVPGLTHDDVARRCKRYAEENHVHLLSPEETRLAGNPLFDYLYGVAALDTGRLSNAIFALQRALAVSPSFSGARLELARAHYDAGNPSLARPLFERLLEEDPPDGVRAVVARR